MKKYYKILIVALLISIIAIFLFLFGHKPVLAPENFNDYKTEEIKIGDKIINVEIADTVEKRSKGLSGRKSMPENQGMLFVFPAPDYYSFWMKNMNFGLDFIWIKGNEIMEITKNVKPEDYQSASTQRGEPPKSLVPKNKIDKVLEVNAGMAEKMGIQEGDKVEF